MGRVGSSGRVAHY